MRQVRERKAEFEESASDAEEGVESIGKGSTAWGGTRREREEGRIGTLARARRRNYRISTDRLVPAFVRYSSTVVVSKCKSKKSERKGRREIE